MAHDDPAAEFDAALSDFKASLTFLTRFPAGWLAGAGEAAPDFSRAARMFPLIGAIVGVVGGAVLLIALWLNEPPLLAAGLAVLATLLFTGGLHEDGLADTADGFGGGATAERKLAIMDDSRVGTYGVVALVFSLGFRVVALGAIAAVGPWRAALALVAAEAISRAALVRLWQELPAAKLSGLAHETGPPTQNAMLFALAIGAAVALILVWPTAGLGPLLVAILLAALATYIFTRISAHEIGGRTGDTLGACQQIAVVAFLLGIAAAG